jgi:hypothetical protein
MQWDESNSMRADVLLEKIDSFLGSHELKLRVPKEIVSGELLPYVPKFLLQNIPAEVRVPLSDSKPMGQGKLQQTDGEITKQRFTTAENTREYLCLLIARVSIRMPHYSRSIILTLLLCLLLEQ